MIDLDTTKSEKIEKANILNKCILELQARLQYYIKKYQELQQAIFDDVHDELEESEDGKTLPTE